MTISPCGRRLTIEFCLVVCVLLFITMPGSLVLAGFDPPYGLMAGATTWISAFVGLSPVALLYLLIRWDALGRLAVPVTVAFTASVLVIAYGTWSLAQPLHANFAAPGYSPSFPAFCLVSVLSAGISLMLFPIGMLPGNYFNDPVFTTLGTVNLVTLVIILVLWWIRSRGD